MIYNVIILCNNVISERGIRMLKRNKIKYVFVMPAILLLIVFVYYPVIKNMIYSFYNMSAFRFMSILSG